MGLLTLQSNALSAGIHFRRQILTSTDVRFRRLKLTPALSGLTILKINLDIYQQDLKMVEVHFANPNNIHSLELVDCINET